MQIGPRYKIARRLGAPVFEKTQTAKYAARKERRGFGGKPKTAYGAQMNEKQKAKMVYGVTEKQFKKYVTEVLDSKAGSQTEALFNTLESRLDNIIFRSGFVSTRRGSRQAVSHGHVLVNGRKVTIPSYQTRTGDVVSIRPQSFNKGVFRELEAKGKEREKASWLEVSFKEGTSKIGTITKPNPTELLFDLQAIFEYYRR